MPRHPHEVASRWLSGVLSARGEPVEVASVDDLETLERKVCANGY